MGTFFTSTIPEEHTVCLQSTVSLNWKGFSIIQIKDTTAEEKNAPSHMLAAVLQIVLYPLIFALLLFSTDT